MVHTESPFVFLTLMESEPFNHAANLPRRRNPAYRDIFPAVELLNVLFCQHAVTAALFSPLLVREFHPLVF